MEQTNQIARKPRFHKIRVMEDGTCRLLIGNKILKSGLTEADATKEMLALGYFLRTSGNEE